MNRAVPHPTLEMRLVETHISWVILADSFVYKIKKPLRLSFLDFSTFSKRAYYCEQEVLLKPKTGPRDVFGGASGYQCLGKGHNRRAKPEKLLTMWSGCVVWMTAGNWICYWHEGEVEVGQMDKIAGILARFHQGAKRVRVSETWKELYEEFADISGPSDLFGGILQGGFRAFIEEVIQWGYGFLRGIRARIEERKESGFVVDGHGDLHCRNIILGDRTRYFRLYRVQRGTPNPRCVE